MSSQTTQKMDAKLVLDKLQGSDGEESFGSYSISDRSRKSSKTNKNMSSKNSINLQEVSRQLTENGQFEFQRKSEHGSNACENEWYQVFLCCCKNKSEPTEEDDE